MPAPGLIALAVKVPHIGVGGLGEVLVLAVSGEESPLGVHRAAGEDVGEQVAGHRLLLQLVPGLVDRLHRLMVRQGGEVGEVAEGLQHDAHHIDLLLLRDVRLGVGLQDGLGRLGVVPLRGMGDQVLNGVEKGVDRAVGEVCLRVDPGVDQVLPGLGLLIEVLIAVQPPKGGGGHRDGGEQPEQPQVPPDGPTPGEQEQGQQEPRRRPEQDGPDGVGQFQGVLSGHVPRLGDQGQIAGQEGVSPQLNFVVVGRRQPQQEEGGGQVGQPAPARKKVKQPDQDHAGQKIQIPQRGGIPVVVRKGGAGQVRAGPGGEIQPQNTQQEPESGQPRRQPEETPGASLGRLCLGQGLGRFKTVQSTFPSLLLNLCKSSGKKYSTDFVEGKEIL